MSYILNSLLKDNTHQLVQHQMMYFLTRLTKLVEYAFHLIPYHLIIFYWCFLRSSISFHCITLHLFISFNIYQIRIYQIEAINICNLYVEKWERNPGQPLIDSIILCLYEMLQCMPLHRRGILIKAIAKTKIKSILLLYLKSQLANKGNKNTQNTIFKVFYYSSILCISLLMIIVMIIVMIVIFFVHLGSNTD